MSDTVSDALSVLRSDFAHLFDRAREQVRGSIAQVPRSRPSGRTALAPTLRLVTDPASTKMMSLRYAGTCSGCCVGLPAGAWATYDRASRTVTCAECSTFDPDDQIFEAGTAGGSAQREFEKRKDKRETRIREQHPHLGGVILALTDEPQRTRLGHRRRGRGRARAQARRGGGGPRAA